MNLYEILQGKLYVSGEPGEVLHPLLTNESCVIDCIHDLDLIGFVCKVYVHVPFNDAPMDIYGKNAKLFHRLLDIALLAAKFIADGEQILVHCLEGRNRSVFVAGLILISMKKSGDITLGNVVNYLRTRRDGALDPNQDNFAEILNTLDGL